MRESTRAERILRRVAEAAARNGPEYLSRRQIDSNNRRWPVGTFLVSCTTPEEREELKHLKSEDVADAHVFNWDVR